MFPFSPILYSLNTATAITAYSACMRLRPIHVRLTSEKLRNVPRICRALSDAMTFLLSVEVMVLVQREGSSVYGDGHI